ncbi:MAG: hypothetical protein K5765_03150 [Clostridia bacterium]|nr:hypothetical protein [Clostridia bacterium]
MAKGKTKLSKKEQKALDKRIAEKNRKKMLNLRKEEALANNRARNSADYYDEDFDYTGVGGNPYAGHLDGTVDREFITDVQRMKFCRKPIGFVMWLFFLIAIVIIAIQFFDIPDATINGYINQYGSFFVEAPAVEQTSEGGENNGEEGIEENGEEAQNAPILANTESIIKEGEEGEGEGETGEGEGETGEGEETEENTETVDPNSYFKLGDPVFGWLKFIVGKMNINGFTLDDKLPASPWYDAQISKIENGMTDNIAKYAILAFPAAIILYAIYALSMSIKLFICWASGDRKIYRHTWVECIIMLLLAAVIMLGAYATTVEIDGKLAFDGILNFVAGTIMNIITPNSVGGFMCNFGMLALVLIPVLNLILSIFLLEKKLRSRDIATPVILYQYKK